MANKLGKIVSVVMVGIAIGTYWMIRNYSPPYMPEQNSLIGKTIVITGATAGLGLESAKRLAAGGANVILTSRSDYKGQQAVDVVKSYLSSTDMNVSYVNQIITYKVIDLDDLKSIKHNVLTQWDDSSTQGGIDVLMNNAGIFALPERQLTIDGFERQIQSNHLGHFVLCALLFPRLNKNARIINLSSVAHQRALYGIPFDNLWKADINYSPFLVYGQTKLANILFTQELQRRIDSAPPDSIVSTMSAIAVHPGVVTTDIWRNLFHSDYTMGMGHILDKLFTLLSQLGILKTVEMGAATQVWISSIEAITADMKGKYFVDCAESPVMVKTEAHVAKQLWSESEQMSGVPFNVVHVSK
jgi:NAD(P)-dependent dehydrogenase (short-subunit alcohol dehydrogenase family)